MKSNNPKENSCDGKIRYDSKSEARQAATALSGRNRVKKQVNAYKCDHCGKHHVGNSRSKKQRKEGYKDKRGGKMDKNDFQAKPTGIDKGFYLVKSNMQK